MMSVSGRLLYLHTWLIPGKLSIFPITGTLLKKLITTGKKPLQNKQNVQVHNHLLTFESFYNKILNVCYTGQNFNI